MKCKATTIARKLRPKKIKDNELLLSISIITSKYAQWHSDQSITLNTVITIYSCLN